MTRSVHPDDSGPIDSEVRPVADVGPVGEGGRERPFVVDLRDPLALDPGLTGSKAAALAKAAVAGLDTLPGVVLTTAFTAACRRRRASRSPRPAVKRASRSWRATGVALVARSSSVLEDTAGSSMAGQFDSVIGISGLRGVRRRRPVGARLPRPTQGWRVRRSRSWSSRSSNPATAACCSGSTRCRGAPTAGWCLRSRVGPNPS